MTALHRYWIEYRDDSGIRRRWGVTALGVSDAWGLIQGAGGPERQPDGATVIEDVDVSTLDRRDMAYVGPTNWRGVWFPGMNVTSPREVPRGRQRADIERTATDSSRDIPEH